MAACSHTSTVDLFDQLLWSGLQRWALPGELPGVAVCEVRELRGAQKCPWVCAADAQLVLGITEWL